MKYATKGIYNCDICGSCFYYYKRTCFSILKNTGTSDCKCFPNKHTNNKTFNFLSWLVYDRCFECLNDHSRHMYRKYITVFGECLE